jgi:methionyl-tRNA synthetase
VWLHEYLDEFPGKEDVLRYVLCANAPETKDNDFTWKDFQARNNSELVAILGNFVNRVLVLTKKYFDGKVPPLKALTDYDEATLKELPAIKQALEDNIENYHFRDALKEAMNLARLGNKYLADTEPWKLAKTDLHRTSTILHIALQICANCGIAFEPFIPFTAQKLRHLLGESPATWEMLGKGDILPEAHPLREAQLLFDKIDDDTVDAQINKLHAMKAANSNKNTPVCL